VDILVFHWSKLQSVKIKKDLLVCHKSKIKLVIIKKHHIIL